MLPLFFLGPPPPISIPSGQSRWKMNHQQGETELVTVMWEALKEEYIYIQPWNIWGKDLIILGLRETKWLLRKMKQCYMLKYDTFFLKTLVKSWSILCEIKGKQKQGKWDITAFTWLNCSLAVLGSGKNLLPLWFSTSSGECGWW